MFCKNIVCFTGKPTGRNKEQRIVLPVPPRKECKYSFSALFHNKRHKRVFAFRKHEFYVLTQNGQESKGPRTVQKRWKGLTAKVRAAYTRDDGYTIFFTRHRYVISFAVELKQIRNKRKWSGLILSRTSSNIAFALRLQLHNFYP